MMRVRISEVDVLGMADEAIEELMPRAEAAVARAALKIVTEAQVNLRKRQGTRTTAAPAGEAPEQDEGDLLLSMKVFRVRKTKYAVRADYGSDNKGAGLHEFGGTVVKDGKRRTYPPRPYVRPAEAASEAAVTAILEAVI